jgi:hypothetical protein
MYIEQCLPSLYLGVQANIQLKKMLRKLIHIHVSTKDLLSWLNISSLEFVDCFLVVNSFAQASKAHGKIINKIIFILKMEKCLAQCQGFIIYKKAGHLATMTAYKEKFSGS